MRIAQAVAWSEIDALMSDYVQQTQMPVDAQNGPNSRPAVGDDAVSDLMGMR